MRNNLLLLAALGLTFVLPPGSPAGAQQASRTWVSGVGDDANPCSRTSPCKTFAGAISKTGAPGEIDCLDPGGFGAVTITRAVSILCDGASNGGVLVAGTNGIVVSLPTATSKVVLSGLDLEGLGSGLSGVLMNGLGQVVIRNSTIRDFTTAGVNLQGAIGVPGTRVVLQNVMITNSNVGLNVAPVTGATNNAVVANTMIDSNTIGISVAGSATVVLGSSFLTGQPTAISVSGGGQVVSYGNNVIRNAGAPTSTLPLQ